MSPNVALYVALRLASRTLAMVPAPLVYRMARVAGWAAYFVVPRARAGVTSNLSIVLSEPAGSKRVRRLARRTFQHDAMNWVDTLRIGSLSIDEIERMVHVPDWSAVDAAMSAGHGLIMITLHLGNHDLVGQVLASRGYRLTVPVERMSPPQLFEFLVKERAAHGINIVPLERAPREMIRALKAGEIVGVAGDRHISGRTEPVELFGHVAALPVGPVALARRLGSPLVLAVGIRKSPGAFDGLIVPLPVQRTGDVDADDTANLDVLARQMERIIARYPEQWLAFSPVWSANAGANGAATMRHHKEAAV